MTKLTVEAIRGLGFEWPRYAIVPDFAVAEGKEVDLSRTLEAMRSSRAFCQEQINAAYRFKQQTGADYADFTERFDEYVSRERDLRQAIAHLEEIVAKADT